ncbi:relaxase/mobilization nuclease domain-containing protein [Pectobacterium aroidearum]|uniref:relaxase/mobilization nuclease domain-containing protein n=1 Tax=Pectobacterium aroidearum TaxID=1201031 RepID=UPI0015DE446E|nr:relaxase/mobilization nuclease domain-containing protein [Pectobacterium aroidearum]MBA0204172.1 relaxase/mobilization nuclease domain-containing protein [Pectobacterium aroidearum]
MKGMQKIKRGKNFAGVVFYALRPASHHKNDPIVIGGNMDGSAAEDLIAEFNTTKTLRPDVVKPVWHNSLRLPKNEALKNSEWSKIADDYMKRMDFSETHLRCYILHDDTEGQHIHIIASRIDLNAGRLYLGKNENLVSTRIIQQLECDYSLTRTKGPELVISPSPASLSKRSTAQKPNGSTTTKPKKRSRNEVMLEKRTGELCPKAIIQDTLEALLANKPSITEFVQQLMAQNIRVVPNIASTGRMNGFSFECQGIAFKASQLGKGYSWSELQHKLDYQPERDNDFLFSLKASVNEASVSEDLDIAITPKIAEEDVNSPIEALTLNKDARQDEYVINYPTALHNEAVASNKEALKETPERNYVTTAFRWLETIPYLNIIIGMLKKMKIPTLKRREKHKTITGVRMVEITPSTPKTAIEIPLIHLKPSPSM